MMGRSQEEPWFIFEMISFWILQKFAKPRITKWQTSHLADLNLLNPSSHLLRCNHHVRHLNKEFYLLLKIVGPCITCANMGTASGRIGTKTEVSAGTFVALFGAVVTWILKRLLGYSCFGVGLTSKNHFKIQPWWPTVGWCQPKPEVEMGQLSGDGEGECLAWKEKDCLKL